MLNSLDTLIAFIVILTVASLFVTIVVQMFSAFLSLRGKNLADGLALAFNKIQPALQGRAHELANHLLSSQLLSDSTTTNKSAGQGVTVSRATPWSWAAPSMGAWKLATAIQPEELYDALKEIAAPEVQRRSSLANARAEQVRAQTALQQAQTALAQAKAGAGSPTPAQLAETTQAETEAQTSVTQADAAVSALEKSAPEDDRGAALAKSASDILEALGKDADNAHALELRVGAVMQIVELLPDNFKTTLKQAIGDSAADLVGTVDVARQRLEKWFNSAQARSQQWFRVHTRLITIIAGTIIAFLFQLDAVDIFRFASTNSTARASLVASADQVMKQGEAILQDPTSLVGKVAASWNTSHPKLPTGDVQGVKNAGGLEQILAANLTKAAAGPDGKAGTADDASPAALQAEVGVATPDALSQQFQSILGQISDEQLEVHRNQLSALTREVGGTGFDLIPKDFHRWQTTSYESHIPGMALFAALLALGAPYWYNVLKNLTNLQPALAQILNTGKPANTDGAKSNSNS